MHGLRRRDLPGDDDGWVLREVLRGEILGCGFIQLRSLCRRNDIHCWVSNLHVAHSIHTGRRLHRLRGLIKKTSVCDGSLNKALADCLQPLALPFLNLALFLLAFKPVALLQPAVGAQFGSTCPKKSQYYFC